MQFLLKGNWIQIHMAYIFLTVQSRLFRNSFDPGVTPNITYLLLLLETWNFNTQENLWVVKNNKNIHNLHNIQLIKMDYQLKLFNLKSNVKQSDIFRESMLLLSFLINKHIFEENQYYSLFENIFQWKLVSCKNQ